MATEVSTYDLDFVTPPRTILDIGANIGAFTLLARERWPNAIITAYEPMPEAFDQLFRNIGHNSSTIPIRAAVRDFQGEASIFIGDRDVTCGFHQLGRQTDRKTLVRCHAAGCLESAEYVKIDTEGCEVEILGQLSLSDTKAIAVEYHRAEDQGQIREITSAHGFDCIRHTPGGPTWGLLIFARPGVLCAPPSRPVRPFVAIPTYGGICPQFVQSLLRLTEEVRTPLALRLMADSSVCRARNTLAAAFLEDDELTDLLFIDSDVIFTPADVQRILSHDIDIVGGFYPKKQDGPADYVYNSLVPPARPGPDCLMPVAYMGTGFLRIRRQVLLKMIEALPDIAYSCDHDHTRIEHAFFTDGVYDSKIHGRRRYLSEDWLFCQRALDLGFQVWGDTGILLRHVGSKSYPDAPGRSAKNNFSALPSTAATDTAGEGVIAPASPAQLLPA